MHPTNRSELWHAQLTLLAAIILQLTVANALRVGPKYAVAGLELLLVIAIGFTAQRRRSTAENPHKFFPRF
jgi:hypothetical protein